MSGGLTPCRQLRPSSWREHVKASKSYMEWEKKKKKKKEEKQNRIGEFCLFDSHCRNKKGEQCEDGAAVLMRFSTLHQLQLQLFQLVKSLGYSQCFRRYELQPLQVYRTDNTDAVARMPIPTSHVVNEESQIHDTQESHNLDSKISDHVNDSVSTRSDEVLK